MNTNVIQSCADIETVVREIIVDSLELPFEASSIDVDAPLFGATQQGGLELDSLSSLEILGGLSDRFKLPFDDVGTADFRSVRTLSAYLRKHGIDG